MSEPHVPPPPPAAPGGGSSDKTAMLILAYLGLLALVPLLVEKEDKNVQWHAKHGLVITALFIAVWIVLGVITATGIGCIFVLGYPIAGIAWLIITILAIMKALKGERFLIPGISDFADKF